MIEVRAERRTLSKHRSLLHAMASARKWSRHTNTQPRIAVPEPRFSAMLASGEIYETAGGEFIDSSRQWVIERA